MHADSAYVPKRLPKSSTTAVRALASGAASVQWGRPPPSSTCAQSAQCGLSWSMQALPRAPSASFHRYSGARMSGAVPAHASRFAVVIAAEAPADDPSEPQSPNHKRAKVRTVHSAGTGIRAATFSRDSTVIAVYPCTVYVVPVNLLSIARLWLAVYVWHAERGGACSQRASHASAPLVAGRRLK